MPSRIVQAKFDPYHQSSPQIIVHLANSPIRSLVFNALNMILVPVWLIRTGCFEKESVCCWKTSSGAVNVRFRAVVNESGSSTIDSEVLTAYLNTGKVPGVSEADSSFFSSFYSFPFLSTSNVAFGDLVTLN